MYFRFSSVFPPFANLLTLNISSLPIQEHHLNILREACPNLCQLFLHSIKGRILYHHFMLTTFPVDWPSLQFVHMTHAFITIDCLKMITSCPRIENVEIYRKLDKSNVEECQAWQEVVDDVMKIGQQRRKKIKLEVNEYDPSKPLPFEKPFGYY